MTQTITYATVQDVFDRNYGSMSLFRHSLCNRLLYTEGMKDFAETLGAYWLIDTVASYMNDVLNTFNKTEDSFYIVEVAVNKEHQGYFEIYHEGWIGNDYHDCITVSRQMIPYIDLPCKVDEEVTTYKFYLELSSLEPTTFTLMLPTEY